MLVLFETSAGFFIFDVLKKGLHKDPNISEHFKSAEDANKAVKLVDFHKFDGSLEALKAATAINQCKLTKSLKSLIKRQLKDTVDGKLAVIDSMLGKSIKEKFDDLKIVSGSNIIRLIKLIRGQVSALIPGILEKHHSAMMVGLGHAVSRYKLKFSPDKVDTMVIQAIKLMGDLDKQLNNYVMRAKEWYGWHFPELITVLKQNSDYIKTILAMGDRKNHDTCDLGFLEGRGDLEHDVIERVRENAKLSMGCEMSEDDIFYCQGLCEQITIFDDYRAYLGSYIETRMSALGPNITKILGASIAAKLVAHAGSLMNLAKTPASTIQLIGAEKALFRAMKTRANTPKYGIIYHAQMVTRVGAKDKGKMSRMVAAKTALAARVDSLGENVQDTEVADKCLSRLEKSKNYWDVRKTLNQSYKNRHQPAPYAGQAPPPPTGYSTKFDSSVSSGSVRRPAEDPAEGEPKAKKSRTETEAREESRTEETSETQTNGNVDAEEPAKKKKKKKSTKEEPMTEEINETETNGNVDAEESERKKKKKKKSKKEESD